MQFKPITSSLIPSQHGEQTIIFATLTFTYLETVTVCPSWAPSFLIRAVQISVYTNTPCILLQHGLHHVGAMGSLPYQTGGHSQKVGTLHPPTAALSTWALSPPSLLGVQGTGHGCFLPTAPLCMEVHRSSCLRPTFRSLGKGWARAIVPGPSSGSFVVSCCTSTPCHGLPQHWGACNAVLPYPIGKARKQKPEGRGAQSLQLLLHLLQPEQQWKPVVATLEPRVCKLTPYRLHAAHRLPAGQPCSERNKFRLGP